MRWSADIAPNTPITPRVGAEKPDGGEIRHQVGDVLRPDPDGRFYFISAGPFEHGRT
jgi:hypothetical protein